ncbi:predicted protein [Plenodomus lingam JN3]|uniref:Predicted protein n=1 Tax=Leptosphaeria maculans (strain JN3 / isolate v23.1.3 / race Av1-4-5-6-7-8) TaxID=985895 RepID=E5ADT3_LEPMJ|nr:predicted protein [Plenodomus lingam JN3]CBY01372.1 predicted protein [Plenodomus lingam JN3]
MAVPNSYFVPGYGISRAVIQNEIRYHCGPDAIVRPYTFQASVHVNGKRELSRLTIWIGSRWVSDYDHWSSLDQGTNRRPEALVARV